MMTNLKKSATVSTKDDLVLCGSRKSDLNAYLTKGDLAYLDKQLKINDQQVVTINCPHQMIFVYLHKGNKDRSRTLEAYRTNGNKIAALANKDKISKLTIVDLNNHPAEVLAMAEGMALGNYQFLKYRTKDAKKGANTLKTILLNSKNISKKEIDQLQIVVDATCASRTLVNEPGIFLTPVQLSKEIQKLGKEAGFKVDVFNKAKIKALKMGGLLAVNSGSMDPPTFNIMEWKPAGAKNKKPIVLVGKGVTFDTGGISLKPAANMDLMKGDMGGAAAVIGAMYAVAKAKLPVHVVGLVPSTDNRPGVKAYTPGDIIHMHNGMTVEVLNTDAEGRMILADALSYARKYKPQLVIDLATLTGAAVAAIGKYGIVSMGTVDKKTFDNLKESGNEVFERVVEFPFWDEYGELVKSSVADIKNLGGPHAGSITAGKFLQNFTDYPWIHLDIAGPALLSENYDYRTKGGSGVGVRLLFDFFKKMN